MKKLKSLYVCITTILAIAFLFNIPTMTLENITISLFVGYMVAYIITIALGSSIKK